METKLSNEQVKQILETSFEERDSDQTMTVKQYLLKLLALVWEEDECFNGKRPFGNSSWQHQIHEILEDAGFYKPCGSYQSDDAALKKLMVQVIAGL